MKFFRVLACLSFLLSVFLGCKPDDNTTLVILDGTSLASGFDIILNTDQGRTDWLSKGPDSFRAAYPAGQQWGFVGIVVAGTQPGGGRPGINLSAYQTMEIELRGEAGGESVDLGIKDNTDPDTGQEKKVRLTLSSAWQPFTFRLADFTTADLKNINLAVELVFVGSPGRTIYFRNLKYIP